MLLVNFVDRACLIGLALGVVLERREDAMRLDLIPAALFCHALEPFEAPTDRGERHCCSLVTETATMTPTPTTTIDDDDEEEEDDDGHGEHNDNAGDDDSGRIVSAKWWY